MAAVEIRIVQSTAKNVVVVGNPFR